MMRIPQAAVRPFVVLCVVVLSVATARSACADTAIENSGVYHTCRVTPSGGVRCWGRNNAGQLGDGTTTDRSAAVEVSGLNERVVAVSAGGYHTCALTASGGVKCWGANGFGQLGDRTTTDRWTPTDVEGLTSGVVAVDAGGHHTCALTATGGVKCWGLNAWGQLGDGTYNARSVPVDVVGLSSGIVAISAGGEHTCALTAAAGAKCWGDNGNGQLGDGTFWNQHAVPVDVSGLTSGVAQLSAGWFHSCAVTTSGGAKCWGRNLEGELGVGNLDAHYTPVDVVGLRNVASLAAGGGHTCAVTTGGLSAFCWGANFFGQLGDFTRTDRPSPVNLPFVGLQIVQMIPGASHTCAVSSTGRVLCWGDNAYGEVGAGTAQRSAPANVAGLSSGARAIDGHSSHLCAIAGTDVRCWGYNGTGQLGDTTTSDRGTPVTVPGVAASAVASGWGHTCVVTVGGGARCWGTNTWGQLGDGTTTSRSTPVDVNGLTSGVAAIASGDSSGTCAITTGGGLKCWGNIYNPTQTTPLDVPGLTSDVLAVAIGSQHACALTRGGGVKCWGANQFGQLGNGTYAGSSKPVDVVGLASGVVAIAAASNHTCAVSSGGGVKCWGANGYGQLGDGTRTWRTAPVDVVGLTGATAVALGDFHTCALTGGTVKCWGYNATGQLGDGTNSDRVLAAAVNGLTEPVVSLASARYTTCALTNKGAVQCWGHNDSGELGDGSLAGRWPAVVAGVGPAIDPATSDFNGDGRPDIVRRDDVSGDIVFWMMNGTAVGTEIHEAGPSGRNWKIAAIADFDLDGKADLVWHNEATGAGEIWFIKNGTAHRNVLGLDRVEDLNWQIAAAADINHDGFPDIIWRNTQTGENRVWYMNGVWFPGWSGHVDTGSLAARSDRNWYVAGAADMNRDGWADLLWRNQATGENAVSFMNYAAEFGSASLEPVSDPAVAIVATGDFNGDGETDIVWRNHATGETSIWLMAETMHVGTVALPSVPLLTSQRPRGDGSIAGHAVWRGDGSSDLSTFPGGVSVVRDRARQQAPVGESQGGAAIPVIVYLPRIR